MNFDNPDLNRAMESIDRCWRYLGRRSCWLPYLIALIFMFLLKRHYSTATADELRWILQPVGWLVNGWDRLPYAWESHIGLVRADHQIIIAPACAGVNFLIMTYGLTIFAFLHHHRTVVRRAGWLVGAFIVAYGVSILTNAARIVLAISLYDAAVEWRAFTPERLHVIAGIATYAGALGLYYGGLQRIMAAKNRTPWQLRGFWLPWMWYITGTVIVPTVHRAWLGRGLPELTYGLTVVVISALILGTTQLCCAVIAVCRSNIHER